MELGLGVHGEPGVERVQLKTAKETVDMILKHLIDSSSATHLPLQSSQPAQIASERSFMEPIF